MAVVVAEPQKHQTDRNLDTAICGQVYYDCYMQSSGVNDVELSVN